MSGSEDPGAGLEIRPIDATDLATLESELQPQEPSIFRQRLEQQRDGTGVFFVAWRDGRPVGHAFVRWVPQEAISPVHPTIQQLGVVEDLQRRGIGSKLLDAAEELVARRGYSQVAMWVAVDNPDALRLYERRGYRDVGVTAPLTWRYVGRDGQRHAHTDLARCVVKPLNEN